MRSNGRAPLRTSQLAVTRVSLQAGERPQVACPICGVWLVLRRGMLAAHRAADQISRCPGSGQRVVIDETSDEWLVRLARAAQAPLAGGQGRVYVAARKVLEPLTGHNGRPVLATSRVDPRRVVLAGGDCRLVCPLCGRWRDVQSAAAGRVAGHGHDGVLGAHRADDAVTRCPGSGQRVLVDETPDQWRVRRRWRQREAARLAPVLRRQQQRLTLELELHHNAIARRQESAMAVATA